MAPPRAAGVAGVPVAKVVDTVGAGDAFAAGLISGRLEGLDWPTAVARANCRSARRPSRWSATWTACRIARRCLPIWVVRRPDEFKPGLRRMARPN